MLAKRCNGTESSLAECGVTVETTDCLVLGFTMPCQPGETAISFFFFNVIIFLFFFSVMIIIFDTAKCNNSNIRLVDGYTDQDGRVEVCVDGQWGTVSFNNQEGVVTPMTTQEEFNVIIFLFFFSVMIIIFDTAKCNNSNIRLVDGYTDQDGRVEVCVNGQWGTVSFNNQEGVVTPMTTQEDNTSTNCQESKVNLQECDTTIITALGAVIGVLVALLAATLIVLPCVIKRKLPTRLKPKYVHVIYKSSI